jgi:hypothetical protein
MWKCFVAVLVIVLAGCGGSGSAGSKDAISASSGTDIRNALDKAGLSCAGIGAVCFGPVVGWVTYRTLARRADGVSLSDIATVIGAVGGAAVVTIFNDKQLFGLYSIGLAVGFFGYLIAYVTLSVRSS